MPTLDYFFCAMEETAPDYGGILGKTVTGKVDRPIGSIHPKHAALHYPINYGYIEGILAADGEEQDAYIFGTDQHWNNLKEKSSKSITGLMIQRISGLFRWMVPICG